MYCRFWVCELGWVESGPLSFPTLVGAFAAAAEI